MMVQLTPTQINMISSLVRERIRLTEQVIQYTTTEWAYQRPSQHIPHMQRALRDLTELLDSLNAAPPPPPPPVDHVWVFEDETHTLQDPAHVSYHSSITIPGRQQTLRWSSGYP